MSEVSELGYREAEKIIKEIIENSGQGFYKNIVSAYGRADHNNRRLIFSFFPTLIIALYKYNWTASKIKKYKHMPFISWDYDYLKMIDAHPNFISLSDAIAEDNYDNYISIIYLLKKANYQRKDEKIFCDLYPNLYKEIADKAWDEIKRR